MAIIGTGAAPGMMCVATKSTMRYLDTCDDILMMVYEGVEAKRFLPFWWSPFTALSDMTDPTFALKDGVLVETEPHSLPVKRHVKGCEKEVTLVEHAHDETVYMGLNKDTHFKGAKNINFKYGGVGIEFSTPLYRAGQCGSLFTKMFVNDDYTQTGLISSDMLTYEECDKYIAYAEKLDITLETEVKPLL